jgi:O-acetyl-ADP-ribose deacetylase (regulator of RNase III)
MVRMNKQNLVTAFLHGRVSVLTGNITEQKVDAVVNAANSTLMGGGGVDGAIHRTGGPKILEECKTIRRAQYPHGLPTGAAVITTGGNLCAQYVIHTIGPVWGQTGGRDAELLAACYLNSLELAVRHELQTLAFPSISTGAFGYPREEAAAVSSTAIENFLIQNPSLDEVRLVFFSSEDANIFLNYHKFSY